MYCPLRHAMRSASLCAGLCLALVVGLAGAAAGRDLEFSNFTVLGYEGRQEGEFFNPEDVLVGPAGELIVADTKNNRIQVLTRDGKVQRLIFPATCTKELAETLVTNAAEKGAKQGSEKVSVRSLNERLPIGSGAQRLPEMKAPTGLALSADQKLYVSAAGNHQIYVYDYRTGELLSVFGKYGRGQGFLVTPQGIDLQHNVSEPLLAICDEGNRRLQLWKTNGTYVHEIHYQEETAKQGLRSLAPRGVHFLRSGDLLVSYPSSHQVVCWQMDGKIRWSYGTMNKGKGKGELNTPTFLDETPEGNILIADSGNSRVVVLDKDGMFRQHLASYGTTPGRLAGPRGLRATDKNALVVVDSGNSRLQIFEPSQISLMLRDAESMCTQDRWEEAMPALEKVLNLEPSNVNARNLYVDGLFYFGDKHFNAQAFEKADETYRRILVFKPDSDKVRDKLNAIFWAKNQDLIVRVVSGIIAAVSALILLAILKSVIGRLLFPATE